MSCWIKLLIFISLYAIIQASDVRGSALINLETFNKLVVKFKATLVKFNEKYPYGPHLETFKELAAATTSQTELLLTEVQVADYGDKDNADFAAKYNIPTQKDNLPVYLLFLNGNTENPIRYKGSGTNLDDLRSFISEHTGLWLGCEGCIEQLDKIARRFGSTDDTDARQAALTEAENLVATLNADSVETGKFYVKVFQQLLSSGNGFVDTELSRIAKLLIGKLTDQKKNQLGRRRNILTAIKMHLTGGRDEL